MHYSNQKLAAELSRLATERAAGREVEVKLPAELPREAFQPSQDVVEFVRTIQDYERQTAHVNVGKY